MSRWLSKLTPLCLAVVLAALAASLPEAASAQTQPGPSASSTTPSLRIGTAALISPSVADSFYGSSTVSSTSIGSYAPPNEIVELSRALSNNPDLIYEFVRNNIDVAWMYGLQKGALGALTDRSGTPFDQAALMVALLRQSGYSASYQAGTVTLTGAQFSAWTGIVNATAACQLLSSGGFPAAINGTTPADCTSYGAATVSSVQLAHIWVSVSIGGTAYLFDPSYKPYSLSSGVNLASAAQYSSGQALTAAGGTIGSNSGIPSVSNLNASALNSALQGWGINLLSYIETNLPAGLLSDLVGGASIVPFVTPSGGLRQTALPYSAVSVQHVWQAGPTDGSGNIPDQYRTRLGVELSKVAADATYYDIVNQTYFVDEIYGRKLTFDPANISPTTFNASLDLTDEFGHRQALVTISTGALPTLSEGYLTLTATHPYAASANGTQVADGSYMSESTTKYVHYVLPFTIVHGWGDIGLGGLDAKWGTRPDRALADFAHGGGCETCFGNYWASEGDGRREQLTASWLAQSSRASRLHAAIAGAVFTHHHSIGVVASENMLSGTFESMSPPGDPLQGQPVPVNQFSVVDSADRIDVDSAISVTSTTANADNRRVAIHAIAATDDALEGSVVAQVADLPDIGSTATRFGWGNAPPVSEDPDGNGQPRPFYEFTAANVANAGVNAFNMITGANTSGSGDGSQAPNQCVVSSTNAGVLSGALAGTISAYATASPAFDVIASGESFLGPGQRCGAFNAETTLTSGDPATANGGQGFRFLPLQRGGALVATQYDSSGNPLQIAHIVIDATGNSKGGGGGVQTNHQAQYDPSTAADLLKSRFADRSKQLGVDLQSGQVSTTSPATLTVGSGGFPYALSAQLIWRGGEVQSTLFGPISHVQPQAPWTTNWNNTLTMSSSALELLGDGDIRATAGTVAAFMAMQDVYRVSPSAQREAAAVLIADWWTQQIVHDVVSVNVGADTRQFVHAVDSSWIATGPGAYAQLTVTGSPTPFTAACGAGAADYQLTRGWDYSSMSFVVTNAHGDKQHFGYWTDQIQDPSSEWCAIQKGFRMASWVFPQGVTINLNYSAGSASALPDLTSVSNTVGQSINFVSSGLGGFSSGTDPRAVTVTLPTDYPASISGTASHTDPAGDVTTYLATVPGDNDYGAGGRYLLTAVYTADNPYNNPGFSSSGPAPNPASLQYFYDSLDRVEMASDAVALQQGTRGPWQWLLADGLRGERLDPLGAAYTAYYDNRKRPLEFIDELGHVTSLIHDGRSRITSVTYPLGDQEVFAYDDHNNSTQKTRYPYASGVAQPATLFISASWNQTWNKPAWIKDALKNETDFSYYPAGVNGASLLATVTQPAVATAGGGTAQPQWSYSYNSVGQITQTQDPTGLISQDNYYSSGPQNGYLQNQIVDAGASPHLNLTTSYTYDTAGNALTVTNPNNHSGSYTYDSDRRRTSDSLSGADGSCQRSENTYTGGLLTKVRQAKVCNPNESDPSTASDSSWAVTFKAYTPTRQPLSTLDPSQYQTVAVYDADDRATDAVQCLSANSSAVTSPSCPGASRDSHTQYNPDGSINQVFKGWGSPDQITYARYSYDNDGSPLTVTDANGNITSSVYDGYERLYRSCLPDSTTPCAATTPPKDYEQYSYDANGNLLTKQNRDGQTLGFAFDALNRETTRTVPNNASGHFGRTLTTAYDLASRKLTETVVDSETGTSTTQTLTNGYDSAMRLTSVSDSLLNALGSNIGSIGYGYDAASNRTTLTLTAKGSSWNPSYSYDDAERLSTLVNAGTTLASYTPDALSRVTAVTFADSSNDQYSYQDNSDLNTLTASYSGTALSYAYTVNGAHQITGKSVSDSSYEMQTASTGAQYNTNVLNQYTLAAGSIHPTYDNDGNLTSDGTFTYEYDEENRLRKATGPHAVQYDYDPQGRRRSKTVDGLITYFVNDGPNELAELDSTGTRQRLYLNGNGMDERLALYTDATQTWDYYHVDHQKNVLFTTRSGAISNAYHYGPYGESADAVTGNPIRYTSRYLDAETNLYFLRARYYSTTCGCFLQTDPIGSKDNLDLYSYTADDPVNNTDPTGTCTGSRIVNDDGTCKSTGGNTTNSAALSFFIKRDAPSSSGNQSLSFFNTDVDHFKSAGIAAGINVAGDALMFIPGGEPEGVALREVSSSKALGSALEDAGFIRPADSAAHHIVAGNAPAAAPARAILKQFGIGINDAGNGVFMNRDVHASIHTLEYYRGVNDALRGASTQEDALSRLSDIRDELLQFTSK